jgi:transposase
VSEQQPDSTHQSYSITERTDAVVRGRTDDRSNAFVEAMSGLQQQAKRAARGFRTATDFIAIAYLRMCRLKHLLAHLLALTPVK